ncbi:protein phosphatase 2C domain-containing protein [Nocardia sp. NBC_00511]|uniref:protein phosphatase 2C domain-containing protein n=1 Tax=Nocardia sp. NBC_00511 TaxID=2903591 RepID=UPI0030E0D77F
MFSWGKHHLDTVIHECPVDLAPPEPIGFPEPFETREPLPSPRELATDAPAIGEGPAAQPLPIMSGLPFALPSVRADGGELRDRWVAAASIAGTIHQSEGTTAQDSYFFMPAQDGSALILAVTDGLGYRPCTAQVGAELLARLCCSQAAAITHADAVTDGTETLVRAIEYANIQLIGIQRAQLPGWHPSDLHTTLLLCRLPLTADGGPMLFARAGDTAAYLLDDAEYTPVFAEVDREEPSNIVESPLPHPNPRDIIQVATAAMRYCGALVLTTDGLAEDITESPQTRAWLAARWTEPCGAHRMIDALRYRRRDSHDDRTALVAWLRPMSGDETWSDAADSDG